MMPADEEEEDMKVSVMTIEKTVEETVSSVSALTWTLSKEREEMEVSASYPEP